MPKPVISVVIPSHDMGKTLPEAVSSVFGQVDFASLEVIIIDDGSEKDKGFGIGDWGGGNRSAVVDGRSVVQLRQPHGGKSVALNHALRNTSGRYIAFLDADDLLPECSLSRRITELEHTGADLLIGRFGVMYRDELTELRKISIPMPKEELIRRILLGIKAPIHLNGTLATVELVRRAGFFDERLLRGQDKDYLATLIKSAERICFLDEVVYHYRKYPRPVSLRLKHRYLGTKGMMVTIGKHYNGWRSIWYKLRVVFVNMCKAGYEIIFGVYKK